MPSFTHAYSQDRQVRGMEEKKKKKIVITIVLVLLVVGVGVTAAVILTRNGGKNEQTLEEPDVTQVANMEDESTQGNTEDTSELSTEEVAEGDGTSEAGSGQEVTGGNHSASNDGNSHNGGNSNNGSSAQNGNAVSGNNSNNGSNGNSNQSGNTGSSGDNGNSNQNGNGGSNGSSGNNGNSGSSGNGSSHPSGGTSTTEKATATEQPATTEKPSGGGSTEHQHNWQAQYKTVHHDEEGHYENVVVEEAYDEKIYESHAFCGYCGLDITASGQNIASHCGTCGPPMDPNDPFYTPGATMGSSYGTKRVQVGTKHHDAVYEKEWVVDKEAYDEQVLTGYTCTTCGATKNN